MNKKAQSQVIVTVLIILIVLASVIIVWNVVNSVVTNSSEEVAIGSFITEVEIDQVILGITGGAEVDVKNVRGEFEALKFIFQKTDGTSKAIDITENMPQQLETKTFSFTDEELEGAIESVSIAPIIDGKPGREIQERDSKIKLDSDGKRAYGSIEDSSIVSWWKFDGNAKDTVGLNDGQLINSPQSVDGISNQAYYFDGSSNLPQIKIPKDPSLNIDSEVSISMWIKVNTWDEKWEEFLKKGTDRIELADPTRTPPHSKGFWANDLFIDKDLWELDEWVHIVYISTNPPNKNFLYVNGVKEGENIKSALPLDDEDLTIGTINRHKKFDGSIDEVIIFNKALTEQELLNIYNNQK